MIPDQLQKMIDQTNLPLAYLESYTWFYGRRFLVNKNVLIPRPETEDIITLAKTLHPTQHNIHPHTPSSCAPLTISPDRAEWCGAVAGPTAPQNIIEYHPSRILDLGTGSGIIPITLALELPSAQITATDISKKALTIAKQNAQNLLKTKKTAQPVIPGLAHSPSPSPITFLHSNLFSHPKLKNKHFDLICANLPYVDPDWPWLNKPALSHEPSIALYATDHGLALIYKLLDQVSAHLTANAHLLLEADPCQHSKIIARAQKNHLTHRQTKNYILHFQS